MPQPRTVRLAAVSVALVALSLIAMSGVLSNGFINYDDDAYVTANAHVLKGLSRDGVAWAFSSLDAANWHPVTWLSHMLDVQLFALDAGKHHATSLLLHAANTVLLFLVLFRMTGALWRCAFVGALFGVHPLHVESVAWAAERKDVLSTLLWILALWAWVRYTEKKTTGRYAAVLAAFALGLMAKPMLVTLPFTLLLLDVWPLEREASWRERVFEKLPLFAMSAASCVVTLVAQRRGGAFEPLAHIGFGARAANAVLSYGTYLWKTVRPKPLAIFYPYPGGDAGSAPLVLSALILIGLITVAIRNDKRTPWLTFGVYWYLGTLVPVIGLVQVGAQSTADRYTYVPLIGAFVAIAWGLGELAELGPAARYAGAAVAAAALIALIPPARAQVRTWADTTSVFEHALAVTSNNDVAHVRLGLVLADQGKNDDALRQYVEALRINPDSAAALNDVGVLLHRLGRDSEAIEELRKAAAAGLDAPEFHVNLGNSLAAGGQRPAAVEEYQRALTLAPDSIEALRNLGNVLHRLGRHDEAIAQFERLVRLRPDDPTARLGLGTALTGAGRMDEGMAEFEAALRLKPDSPIVLNNVGNVLMKKGRTAEAIARYEQAVRLKPDYAEALNNLGQALGTVNRIPESIDRFRRAIELKPESAEFHNNLGISLARDNRYSEAMEQFQTALRLEPSFGPAKKNLDGLQEYLKQRK